MAVHTDRPRQAGSARHLEAALITSAEPSLSEQIDARRRRYAVTMAVRTLCLVLASLVSVTLSGWLRWVLLALTVLGAVALPWIAVLVANDRPPKTRAERRAAWHPDPNPQPALPKPVKIIDG